MLEVYVQDFSPHWGIFSMTYITSKFALWEWHGQPFNLSVMFVRGMIQRGRGGGGGRNRAWALVAMLSQPSLRPPYFFVHMRFRWFYNICTRAQHKSTDKNLNDWFASCKRIASISFKGMYGKLLLHPIPLGWTGFLLVVLQLPRKFKTLCIMTNWRWDICASRLPSTISRCVHGQCPTFLPH